MHRAEAAVADALDELEVVELARPGADGHGLGHRDGPEMPFTAPALCARRGPPLLPAFRTPPAKDFRRRLESCQMWPTCVAADPVGAC